MSPPSPNSRRGVPIRCLSELGNGFRAAQPWYTLAAPEIVTPIVDSFLSHYRTFGRLPVMSYGGKNADCMVGNHAVPVIADAWLKGFRGFDAALAFEAMTNTLTVAHPGKPKKKWASWGQAPLAPVTPCGTSLNAETLERRKGFCVKMSC